MFGVWTSIIGRRSAASDIRFFGLDSWFSICVRCVVCNVSCVCCGRKGEDGEGRACLLFVASCVAWSPTVQGFTTMSSRHTHHTPYFSNLHVTCSISSSFLNTVPLQQTESHHTLFLFDHRLVEQVLPLGNRTPQRRLQNYGPSAVLLPTCALGCLSLNCLLKIILLFVPTSTADHRGATGLPDGQHHLTAIASTHIQTQTRAWGARHLAWRENPRWNRTHIPRASVWLKLISFQSHATRPVVRRHRPFCLPIIRLSGAQLWPTLRLSTSESFLPRFKYEALLVSSSRSHLAFLRTQFFL